MRDVTEVARFRAQGLKALRVQGLLGIGLGCVGFRVYRDEGLGIWLSTALPTPSRSVNPIKQAGIESLATALEE